MKLRIFVVFCVPRYVIAVDMLLIRIAYHIRVVARRRVHCAIERMYAYENELLLFYAQKFHKFRHFDFN